MGPSRPLPVPRRRRVDPSGHLHVPSLVAHSWRVGRILLAGDAAHQMPPFLGQGMCSGIGTPKTWLSSSIWRCAVETPICLDTYQQERDPHVRVVIERGIELGREQTVRDPLIAAERDRRLIAQRAASEMPAKIRLPGLTDGFLATHSGPGRGELSVQGIVDDGTGRNRFDSIAGHGFQFLVTAGGVAGAGGRRDGGSPAGGWGGFVGLANQPGTDGAVVDVDGIYQHWFTEHRCVAVAVRPDFYVYGSAVDAPCVRALADDLLNALGVEMSMPERLVKTR